jgi:hypothetical protein
LAGETVELPAPRPFIIGQDGPRCHRATNRAPGWSRAFPRSGSLISSLMGSASRKPRRQIARCRAAALPGTKAPTPPARTPRRPTFGNLTLGKRFRTHCSGTPGSSGGGCLATSRKTRAVNRRIPRLYSSVHQAPLSPAPRACRQPNARLPTTKPSNESQSARRRRPTLQADNAIWVP